MQNLTTPIKSLNYLTIDGNNLNEKNLLLTVDVLILNFCPQNKCVLTNCLMDGVEIYYFDDAWHTTKLVDLPECATKVFVPKQSFLNKRRFAYQDVVDIIDFLRSPKGCPWDRAQTSQNIRTNIIEEAYELVDAIDLDSTPKMTEEVGDVLLQAVFVALMEADKNKFDEFDVYHGLCTKLISRHTHIFGNDQAQNDQDALSVWEANKQKEKKFSTHTQNLLDVPQGMSALLRAQKVGKRASKTGMDWQDANGVVEKCLEEIAELLSAIKSKDNVETEKEMGDLLFSLVNLCRHLDVTAEVALTGATNKFINRFERVEKILTQQGKEFKDCTAEQLDKLWQEAKQGE